MAAQPKRYYTPDEYLALERAAEYKSEYFAGEIFAMSGASEAHNLITGNLGAMLHAQFRGRTCRAYGSDMRVQVAPTGLYTYPDVSAICGPREFADAQKDTLLNPTVLFEVLSPATEAYDRGAKFAHYRGLESLQEYVLVAQDKVQVEQYVRQGDDWLLHVARNLEDVINLRSVNAMLPLADTFEDVSFPAAPPAPAGERPAGPASAP